MGKRFFKAQVWTEKSLRRCNSRESRRTSCRSEGGRGPRTCPSWERCSGKAAASRLEAVTSSFRSFPAAGNLKWYKLLVGRAQHAESPGSRLSKSVILTNHSEHKHTAALKLVDGMHMDWPKVNPH